MRICDLCGEEFQESEGHDFVRLVETLRGEHLRLYISLYAQSQSASKQLDVCEKCKRHGALQVLFDDDDPLRGLAELVGGKFGDAPDNSREGCINLAYETLADAYPDLVKLTPDLDPDVGPIEVAEPEEEATDGKDV